MIALTWFFTRLNLEPPSQKADADKQVAVLSQALEVTKTDLKASQNRAEVLSDENKLILQEKAVIQGQFKQLQESLSR
ncbi:hypothetical protein B5L76_06730 [Enterobacter hormaechei subsp. xiangfangensis]|nr:hypothetical protein AM432_19295 [Enterobacter cloacae complex sp.]ASB85292.1 hypothetical protein AM383_18670 [Enterobacter cloacae complex sp.]OUR01264.1 hypothetical protein B5L76_06730 [Enterobacter hormaechei subsp. xiangfangensis]